MADRQAPGRSETSEDRIGRMHDALETFRRAQEGERTPPPWEAAKQEAAVRRPPQRPTGGVSELVAQARIGPWPSRAA
jgi:hypothetical protein